MPYKNPIQQKAAQHRWYLRNKDEVLEKSRKDKTEKRKYLNKQKDRPCQDCGVRYPWYVMDFDHREDQSKRMTIGEAAHKLGWDKLKKEIAKCDVICSNCHRMRTAKQQGWYKINEA